MTLLLMCIVCLVFETAASTTLEELQKLKYIEKPSGSSTEAWCNYCPFMVNNAMKSQDQNEVSDDMEAEIADLILRKTFKDERYWLMEKVVPLLTDANGDTNKRRPSSDEICGIVYPCSYATGVADTNSHQSEPILCTLCIDIVGAFLNETANALVNDTLAKCNAPITTSSPFKESKSANLKCGKGFIICNMLEKLLPVIEKAVPMDICKSLPICDSKSVEVQQTDLFNFQEEERSINPFPNVNLCQLVEDPGCDYFVELMLSFGLENQTAKLMEEVLNKSLSLCAGNKRTFIQKICSNSTFATQICDCVCELLGDTSTSNPCWERFTPENCDNVVKDVLGIMMLNFEAFVLDYRNRLCPWVDGVCNDIAKYGFR